MWGSSVTRRASNTSARDTKLSQKKAKRKRLLFRKIISKAYLKSNPDLLRQELPNPLKKQ